MDERSEMLKKRDAVARECVFGARSVRGTRRISERDIKTKEEEILVLIQVLIKLFLFLNTFYLSSASARAILRKVSTRFRGRNNIHLDLHYNLAEYITVRKIKVLIFHVAERTT